MGVVLGLFLGFDLEFGFEKRCDFGFSLGVWFRSHQREIPPIQPVQMGYLQSLIVLRLNAEGEENHPSMASKHHTSLQKACSWHVLVLWTCLVKMKNTQHIKRHVKAWHVH